MIHKFKVISLFYQLIFTIYFNFFLILQKLTLFTYGVNPINFDNYYHL